MWKGKLTKIRNKKSFLNSRLCPILSRTFYLNLTSEILTLSVSSRPVTPLPETACLVDDNGHIRKTNCVNVARFIYVEPTQRHESIFAIYIWKWPSVQEHSIIPDSIAIDFWVTFSCDRRIVQRWQTHTQRWMDVLYWSTRGNFRK